LNRTLSHLLRFFAHLVLIMRLLKQAVPEYAANRILEAYVKVLEATNQDENLIAFYASNLDDDRAVESYAQFLISTPASHSVGVAYTNRYAWNSFRS
jgi:nuclear pore complex protein Nup107